MGGQRATVKMIRIKAGQAVKFSPPTTFAMLRENAPPPTIRSISQKYKLRVAYSPVRDLGSRAWRSRLTTISNMVFM